MKSLWTAYKKTPLLTRMFVALILGIVLGLVMGEDASVLAPFGTLFLTLLQMVAMPLIIVNLLAGICSLSDPKLFGKIGIKVLIYYMATTIFAMVIGICVANVIQPGAGFELGGEFTMSDYAAPTVSAVLLSMVPSNIFVALTSGRVDQVVIFLAMFGIATLFLPAEKREPIANFCLILSDAFAKLMGGIMLYAPIGICALMAKTVGNYGNMMGSLAKYVLSVYTSSICMLCVYLVLLFIFTRIKPTYFLPKAAPLMVSTVSTCSSVATLPVSLRCAEELKVPKSIASFAIPLGNQINRDGMGIFFATSFIFTAQAAGVTFGLGSLIQMLLISLLFTTGVGGIPGGAMVFLAMMLESFGLPFEIVGIIAGIHTVNEMGLTTLNCLGDLVGTLIATFSGKGNEHPSVKSKVYEGK